jgi:hypothetical protein
VSLLIFNASRPSGIDTAFGDLVQQRADALQVSSDGFLLTHPDQIVALASRQRRATASAGCNAGRGLNRLVGAVEELIFGIVCGCSLDCGGLGGSSLPECSLRMAPDPTKAYRETGV